MSTVRLAHAPEIAYRIETAEERAEVRTRFSASQLELLEKLNRADRHRLDWLPLLVVPERWLDDERAYSPMPAEYVAAASHPKLLVVHLQGQMSGAYEFGTLVRWGPVSSGAAASPTPAGLFALTWKSPGHVSSINPEWFMRWYFNFDSAAGLAFHEYSLPGHAASHGCLRLLARDARWLYAWGEGWTIDPRTGRVITPGTPVLILGAHDQTNPAPWRSLEWLRQPVDLTTNRVDLTTNRVRS